MTPRMISWLTVFVVILGVRSFYNMMMSEGKVNFEWFMDLGVLIVSLGYFASYVVVASYLG